VVLKYWDSEQNIKIAEAGLERLQGFPSNSQFYKSGGAVSENGKHDKRLQLLIDAWPKLPDADRQRLSSLISDRINEDH